MLSDNENKNAHSRRRRPLLSLPAPISSTCPLRQLFCRKTSTHNFGFELQIPLAFNYTLNNILGTSKFYARKETMIRRSLPLMKEIT